MITLGDLLRMQREFMNLIGVEGYPVAHPAESLLVKDTLAMIADEVSEAYRPTINNSKPWKPAPAIAQRDSEVREEVIDILFFLLELFIVMDMSEAEIFAAYDLKMSVNQERLRSAIAGNFENTRTLPGGDLPVDKVYDLLKTLSYSARAVSVRRLATEAVSVYEGRSTSDPDHVNKGSHEYVYGRAAKAYAITSSADAEHDLLGAVLGLQLSQS